MKISSVIVTTIFVGAAGLIAGTLFFIPGKGVKTRNKISKKGHEYKDYLVDNFDDISN